MTQRLREYVRKIEVKAESERESEDLSMSLTAVNLVAGTGSDNGTDIITGHLRRLSEDMFLHLHNITPSSTSVTCYKSVHRTA